jgi:hypothetical protein
LPIIETCKKLAKLDFAAEQPMLAELVSELIERKLVAVNPVTASTLERLDTIQTALSRRLYLPITLYPFISQNHGIHAGRILSKVRCLIYTIPDA